MKLRKSIDVKIWQVIEKVTSNCTVFAPRSYFVNEISEEPAVVTMATPISSHVKEKK